MERERIEVPLTLNGCKGSQGSTSVGHRVGRLKSRRCVYGLHAVRVLLVSAGTGILHARRYDCHAVRALVRLYRVAQHG